MLASIGFAGLVVWVLLGALLLPSAFAANGVRAFYGGPGTTGGKFENGRDGIAINQAGTGGAAAGDIYVVDAASNRVQQFTKDGEFVRVFGLDVEGTSSNTCTEPASCKAGKASGQAGGMSTPEGIAVDQGTGNLYVSDAGNHRIDVFSATGVFEGAFGWEVNAEAPAEALQFCTAATGCQAGSEGAGAGQFARETDAAVIEGIAVSPLNGHILVASPHNRRVDEFAPVLTGPLVTGVTFVRGFGWGAATGADEFQICTATCHAPGSALGTGLGQFGAFQPAGLAVNRSGTIFVPDGSFTPAEERSRVMTFAPSGQPIGVFAPGAFHGGSEPGQGIAVNEASGNLLVTRSTEELVEFNPAGTEGETYLKGLGLNVVGSLVAVNDASGVIYVTTEQGFVALGEIVPPEVSIEPVTKFNLGPTGVSATFEGHINPEGLETGYHFEYSRDGINWTREPKADIFLPSDTINHEAQPQTVDGLEGLTEYHVRLVATKIFNSGSAAAETTFSTPSAPPVVSAPSVTEVSDSAAVLHATLNPENQATRYRFECVTEQHFAESGFADAFDVPPGNEPTVGGGEAVEVSQRFEGLTPVTTYHCRLVAQNAAGPAIGPEAFFTTFQAAAGGLPDNRAYEQASPVDKNGNNILGEVNAVQASRDGEAITFFTPGGVPGGEGGQDAPVYIARRAVDGNGWATQGLLPPAVTGPFGKVLGWDEGLLAAVDRNSGALGEGFQFYRRDNSSRELTAMASNETGERFSYAASSRNTQITLFEETGDPLAPGAVPGASNAYVWDQATRQLRLVGILNDGRAPAEGTFAGPYRWFKGENGNTAEGGAAALYYTEPVHALSVDGKTAFFTSKGSGQLYMRTNPLASQSPVDGQGKCVQPETDACTVQISASQKTNGEGSGGTDSAGPQPAAFVGATADGSMTLLLSSEELTNDANTGSAGISRSSISGTGVEESFIPAAASAVAVNGLHIYWANPASNSIGRANLDGTEVEPTFITGASNPQGVAVDATHIYWSNAGPGTEKSGTIGRALLDGSEINQSFIKGATNPQGVAVTGSFIFWANAGATEGTRKIGRANLDGTGAIQTFITVGGSTGASGLAIAEPHIFWTNPGLSAIGRATTAGGEVSTELIQKGASQVATPRGIAAGAQGLYWANTGTGTIAHAGLNGENVEATFIKGRTRPSGVAVDASHLYWTENKADEGKDLYRFDAANGLLTDLSPDPAETRGAEVKGVLGMSEDGSYVYFVAAGALATGVSRESCSGAGEKVSGLCNLYLWHDGVTTYVTTLEAGVNGKVNEGSTSNARGDMFDWLPTSIWGGGNKNANTARVSSNGTLLFRSILPLTGYHNVGPCDVQAGGVSQGVCPELFRYEPGASPKLNCVSCSPTDAPPAGMASVQEYQGSLIKPAIPLGMKTRNLSADGTKVFFNTPDKLIATDRNGVNDVYEWEANGSGTCRSDAENGGCLSLMSSGTSPQPSFFADASVSGSDAFFLTTQPLVGQDRDELVDVYDAREHGGIAGQNPQEERVCSGEDLCRPPVVAPPGSASPAGPSAEGNIKPPPKCRKGFKRVKRHGKTRCVRVHHKKHNGHKKHGHKKHNGHKGDEKHKADKRRGKGVNR